MNEPSNTCPEIDSHIWEVEGIIADMKDIKDLFEQCREANENLRSWAHKEIEERDSIIAALEEEIEELKDK